MAARALLHETGIRVRTLSLFYDEWPGKLPVAELERMALMFDIGEVHRARHGLRHLVRPGLTGRSQVKYPYEAHGIDALEKLQHEFYNLGCR